ncbi:hypothetical protein [Sinomicrobium pectinilyticum]|nr:hypothetical protein [Sinomicrobium pectinilyticum]
MKICYIKSMEKNNLCLLGLFFVSILWSCDTEGDQVEEETYVQVRSYGFTKIGDTENELGFYINGDSLGPSDNYYTKGAELHIELKKKESGEVLLDSTRIAVFGEDIAITAFYTGEIVIPMKPLTGEDKEPASEGYKKVRYINFIKDGGLLEGRNLTLEVYGVYYTGTNAAGFQNEAMTDGPIYVIENIGTDEFTPFIELPELETVNANTGLELEKIVAKIYDANTGDLLMDAYEEEKEVFPGFPDWGTNVSVQGIQLGGLRNATWNITTIQLNGYWYEYNGEMLYYYNETGIDALSE